MAKRSAEDSPMPSKFARHDDSGSGDDQSPLYPNVAMTPGTRAFHPKTNVNMKYIVVSGGVCSSLGKGTTTSSIGALLRANGYRVTAIKLDPYINVDAGLMSPFEHGEVYVLDDGGETDLDLGNYERWMDLSLSGMNNITTGKIYERVIEKERRGGYLGKTVQVVPHVTGCVREWINEVAQKYADMSTRCPQVCLIELGGTVGDIESMPFIEALRQLKFDLPDNSFVWCHVSYIPTFSGQKTKPTQHTVKTLLSLGLQPDIVVCRSSSVLEESTRKKISNQCNIKRENIWSCHDVSNLFHLPGMLAEQGAVRILERMLALPQLSRETLPELPSMRSKTLEMWNEYALKVDKCTKAEELRIAFVGKYVQGGSDAYASVFASLEYAASEVGRKLRVEVVDAGDLAGDAGEAPPEEKTEAAMKILKSAHGIFVPGGFGVRGVEGKVKAASLARQWKKPYLGVCLGMQVAVIAFARDMLKLPKANSSEFDSSTADPVLLHMPEVSQNRMGGTARLGARMVHLVRPTDSIVGCLYGGARRVSERHRHRYEVNTEYKQRMESAGLQFTAVDDQKERMEAVELPRAGDRSHPFYLGVQYHPEYKTRPGRPSPPYYGFLAAAAVHDPATGATNSDRVSEFLAKLLAEGPSPHYSPLLG